MAKRISMKGLGRDIYFKGAPDEESKSANQLTDKQIKQQIPFERATFYLRPGQQEGLEKLKISLRSKLKQQGGTRRRQVDKSELIRVALDLLAEQNEDILLKRLTSKGF